MRCCERFLKARLDTNFSGLKQAKILVRVDYKWHRFESSLRLSVNKVWKLTGFLMRAWRSFGGKNHSKGKVFFFEEEAKGLMENNLEISFFLNNEKKYIYIFMRGFLLSFFFFFYFSTKKNKKCLNLESWPRPQRDANSLVELYGNQSILSARPAAYVMPLYFNKVKEKTEKENFLLMDFPKWFHLFKFFLISNRKWIFFTFI